MRATLSRSVVGLAAASVLALGGASLAGAGTKPTPPKNESHVFLCYSPKHSDDVKSFGVSRQAWALTHGYVLPVAVLGYKPISGNGKTLGGYGLKCNATTAKPTGNFISGGGKRLVGPQFDPAKGHTGTYLEAI